MTTARRVLRRWWRRRSLVEARLVLVVVAAVGLLCGAGVGSLVAPGPQVPRAGVGPALPGATSVGPLAVVLPDDLGPWTAVPEERMARVRDAAAERDVRLDGAWGLLAPDGVLVTVLGAPAGAHGGAASVSGPFESGRVELPWRGRAPHRAGVRAESGVREAVLVLETPDGHLLVLSVSGPTEVLTREVAVEILRTVRLPG